MQTIEYAASTEMHEALGLLAERREQVTIWAGGTDLGPKLHSRELQPRTI